MAGSEEKRIEGAWGKVKGWITDFDGSPTAMYLVNAPVDAVAPALQQIEAESESFRITRISADQPEEAQFISLDEFSENLSRLMQGKVDDLSANYAYRSEPFDLDIRVVIYPLEAQKVALEVFWWSDQVFSEETDNLAQFQDLMRYFIHLQELFHSPTLFLSPETVEGPGRGSEAWVEV